MAISAAAVATDEGRIHLKDGADVATVLAAWIVEVISTAGYLGVAVTAFASGALAASIAPRTVVWVGALAIVWLKSLGADHFEVWHPSS